MNVRFICANCSDYLVEDPISPVGDLTIYMHLNNSTLNNCSDIVAVLLTQEQINAKHTLDSLSGTDWNSPLNRINGYTVDQLRKWYNDEAICRFITRVIELQSEMLGSEEMIWKG